MASASSDESPLSSVAGTPSSPPRHSLNQLRDRRDNHHTDNRDKDFSLKLDTKYLSLPSASETDFYNSPLQRRDSEEAFSDSFNSPSLSSCISPAPGSGLGPSPVSLTPRRLNEESKEELNIYNIHKKSVSDVSFLPPPPPASRPKPNGYSRSSASLSIPNAESPLSLSRSLPGQREPSVVDLDALFSNPDKVKKQCRIGFIESQRCEAWWRLVKLNTDSDLDSYEAEYEGVKAELFNGLSVKSRFPHVPNFGSRVRFDSYTWKLSGDTIKTAKSVLCVVASQCPEAVHCPCLIDWCIILLDRGFTESKCYAMLIGMIKASRNHNFYFTLSSSAFIKQLKSIYVLLCNKVPAVATHAQSVSVDIKNVIAEWIERFFVSYLPISTVLRILDCYLNEGHKILYRVILGLHKLYESHLKKTLNADEFKSCISQRMSVEMADCLLKVSFGLYLSREHIRGASTSTQPFSVDYLPSPPRVFHLPRYDGSSPCMSQEACCKLWSWLPPDLRILDPVRLYSTSIHGYSYNDLLKSAGHADRPIFILIRSLANEVCGALLPRSWDASQKLTRQPVDVSRLFLFTFAPKLYQYRHSFFIPSAEELEQERIEWEESQSVDPENPENSEDTKPGYELRASLVRAESSSKDCFMLLTEDTFSLGDSTGTAIAFDNSLKFMRSHAVAAFYNPPLFKHSPEAASQAAKDRSPLGSAKLDVGKETLTKIADIEVWGFKHPHSQTVLLYS